MELHDEILELIRNKMEYEYDEYINPNFLNIVLKAIYDYYGIEDDEIESWVSDMFGM